MSEYEGISGVWRQQGNRRIMDDISAGGHRRVDTRPTLGFPLGTALILLIVFGISALFSCCYHWEKIRNLHGRHHHTTNNSSDMPSTPHGLVITPNLPLATDANVSSTPPSKNSRLHQSRSLPVMMPGDDVPKFIACPSPHGFPSEFLGEMASSDANRSKYTRSLG